MFVNICRGFYEPENRWVILGVFSQETQIETMVDWVQNHPLFFIFSKFEFRPFNVQMPSDSLGNETI